jgi:uncharacterized membrane protein
MNTSTRQAARWPAALALVGAIGGLTFASLSTLDYVRHLDRQVHGIHCSLLPGATAEESAATGCRTAMYSAYSAVMKGDVWGGVPIGLFAVGAFSFFIALSLYVLLGHQRASRRSVALLAGAGLTPLLVSVVMAVISATQLGTFCQTCIGIYISSAVLAVGGVLAWRDDRVIAKTALASFEADDDPDAVDGAAMDAPAGPRPMGPKPLAIVGLALLGVFAVVPAAVYLRSVPNYTDRVVGCGKLSDTSDPKSALISMKGKSARQPVTMIVDPLCPTCKGFHERLVTEGYFDAMDAKVVLFPLDSECNWNLATPLHPGACLVSRAVICAPGRELAMLEWAYDEQETLLETAKKKDGEATVAAMIEQRWPGTKACIEDAKTAQRLDEMMRFATRNKLPVSTPQLFVGDAKLCDEDIDMGLVFALSRLAPTLLPK